MPLRPGRKEESRLRPKIFPGALTVTGISPRYKEGSRLNPASYHAFAGKRPVHGRPRGGQAYMAPYSTNGAIFAVISALPAKPSATPARLSIPASSTEVKWASPPASAWRSSAVR